MLLGKALAAAVATGEGAAMGHRLSTPERSRSGPPLQTGSGSSGQQMA